MTLALLILCRLYLCGSGLHGHIRAGELGCLRAHALRWAKDRLDKVPVNMGEYAHSR